MEQLGTRTGVRRGGQAASAPADRRSSERAEQQLSGAHRSNDARSETHRHGREGDERG